MKVVICFGTRPEVIKLSLLSQKILSETDLEVINVFTGQHHSLYEDVKHLIPNIDYTIPLKEYSSLDVLYAELITHISALFDKIKPDLVIVQGDTASAYCAAFCAFVRGIKIGHVEAGLRTYDMSSPFPEEFNRQTIGKIAYFNWCPSILSVESLKEEKVNGKIIFTGNTIVDFIYNKFDMRKISYGNSIVITLHRRENKDVFQKILNQINEVAKENRDLTFLFPVHPNPNIRKQVGILQEKNIIVCNPLKYEDFIGVLMSCRGIITDSGGIQEEALCLRKKVLICRNNTERKEGINVGISKLVGDQIKDHFNWLLTPFDKKYVNPYGNGDACDKIINSIKEDII